MFLAILYSLDGRHISNRQINASHMCVCVFVYLPVKVGTRMSLERRHFMRWKIAHPWWGLNPRSLDYIPSSINSCHVSDHQSIASHIYFYISEAPDQKIVHENDKNYELKMSDDGHFEFRYLWENSATYSLAYGRNGFSTKNSYRTNRWSTFPQKCLQVFIRGYISIICPDY